MDGSNGANGSNGGDGNPATRQQQQQQRTLPPGDSSRAVRAELDARRRVMEERSQKYKPAVKEQVQRVFGDTKPAWYARARMFSREMYAQLAYLGVAGLAVPEDRMLTDAEARAVTEHIARGADRSALLGWALSGAALYFTWRGRHTLRLPMYTPTVTPPPPNAYLRRAMWFGGRYVAYSMAFSVTLQPPLLMYNIMYERQQMAADFRLRGLVDENGHFGHLKPGADPMGGPQMPLRERRATGDDAEQQQQYQQQESIQESAQSGWETYKQVQQQQQQQQSPPSQTSAGWDSQQSSKPGWDSDDVDDASPVASSQNDSSYSGGGSAWDRLRQKSQAPTPQAQQQQRQRQQQQQSQQSQAWGSQQSQQSKEGGWGDAGDGVDRVAQDKAQREFDQMLDRERQGDSQGRSGWSGR